eukprot:CAMPEP_0194131906 /NCGR_PEP_ID=MMETSP0152-20130528/2528_1 /TAXON_ID=1049557 /ORGANISM="Thalassiothrix antarctica, Strain L6-D1" /LENGTH=411 /DNA_ID=CAMNT_0038826801 /DNA_START=94 /DNA_END=1329 /DNA_ORIENTATION=-
MFNQSAANLSLSQVNSSDVSIVTQVNSSNVSVVTQVNSSNVVSIESFIESIEDERHNGLPNELNVSGLETYSPTESPSTSLPSLSPSVIPSSFPSVYPSPNPSTSPSHFPSKLPSNFPSRFPSFKPSKQASFSPTNSPTDLPSSLPSVKPSLSIDPSSYPSAIPSASPSSAPSLPECSVDDSGFYGERNGDITGTRVDYFYQVRLIPNTTLSEFEGEILNSLETAIAKKLLPDLFQDSCGDYQKQRTRQRSLQQITISAVSAQPPDFVFNEVLCEGSEIDCFVVDAQMMVYGNDLNSTKVSDFMTKKIKNSMDSGELNNGVDERLTSVEYLDDITGLRNKESLSGGTLRNTGAETRLPIWSITIIASFGALFLVGGFVLWQRRRKSNAEDENMSAIDSEVNTEEIQQRPIS